MKDRFMHILSLKAADWLAGVIRLEITGFCGERLLTKCAAEGVEFWDIKRTSPERLVVSIYSFRLSTVYAVYNANNGFSPHLEINEIQNIGFLRFLSANRHRSGLLVGLLISVITFAVMISFIWSIEITGTYNISKDDILRALENEGFYVGSPVNGHDLNQIQLSLMRDFDNMAFVTVNISGCTAQVEVTESVVPPELDDKSPCNIVAKCDGILVDTEVYQGVRMVRDFDTVTEGQLLVGGIYTSKVIGYRLVHSSAKMMAYTNRRFEEYIPFAQTEYVASGRKATSYYIEIFSMEFKIPFIGNNSYTYKDETNEKSRLSVGNGLYLPIAITACTEEELEAVEKTVTPEQAIELARARTNEKMRLALRDCEVISISETASMTQDGVTFIADCFVLEDIAQTSEILVKIKD